LDDPEVVERTTSSPPGPTGLRIRTAGPGDAAVLATLLRGFRDHLRASAPSDLEFERHLPRVLADPAVEFSCAWLDGEPVGYTQTRFFTSLWTSGLEAQLDDLFVVAAARGRSVGRSLLRHAIARAEARGARRFALNTNEGNQAAQSLYRSEGLSPQSHALYPGGREVLWVKEIGAARVARPGRET
jgi:ribosomal protein S18 acetylase RimI-like enzyme